MVNDFRRLIVHVVATDHRRPTHVLVGHHQDEPSTPRMMDLAQDNESLAQLKQKKESCETLVARATTHAFQADLQIMSLQ